MRQDALSQIALRRVQKRRGRLPRPPAPLKPLRVERQYTRELLRIMSFLHDLVKERLIPKLAHYRDLAPSIYPSLRKDDMTEDLFGDIDTIRVFFGQTYSKKTLKRVAEAIAENVNEINADNFENQIQRVLGIDIFGSDPALSSVVDSFATNNARLIKTVADRYLNQVSDTVFNGMTEGLRWEEIADQVEERFGVSQWDAERLARDQVNKLNGNLTEERQSNIGVKSYIWRTALDDRVRDSHMMKEGQTYDWDSPPADTGHPGEDILCFLPDTQITFLSQPMKGFERQYTGEIVRLTTESGRVIQGTPNHPILTFDGWKPLKEINSSDQLFERADTNVIKTFCAEVNDAPSTAKEMFNLFSVISPGQRVSGVDQHFHGDGSDEQINIVSVQSSLLDYRQAAIFKQINQFIFELSDFGASDLLSLCYLGKHFIAPHYAGTGSVGSSNLKSSLGNIHARPLELFSFRSPSDRHTSIDQSISDNTACYSQSFRDGILALSSEIKRLNLFNINLFLIPGNDSLFKITSVKTHETDSYSGPVYNFETSSGTYLASNLLASNCRCFAEPILDDLID